ncbi:MAG: hypothetical protein SCALA702_12040 [Melioribacteraceae bacterium]|nr:MAG: hypothetical protein SCALA702_12040 [Melioribacteraceae bacterium]
MRKIIPVLFLATTVALAQYTTPGTGVNWGIDELVTNSGGEVTGSAGNYEVNGLITISANDKVSIENSNEVKFTNIDAGFEINGALSATGIVDNYLIFTSDNEDSTGAYTGFRFNETSVDAECVFQYVRIEYAETGFRAVNASPSLKNSQLYKCSRGVQLSGSDAQILFNTIERCYEYGITMTLGSSPIIEGNVIRFNNTQNTSAKNQISVGLQGNNSPHIINNAIYGGESTVTGGISIWVNGATNFSNAIINGNEIYNNSFGITLYSSSNGVVNVDVRNNHIHDNNVNPNTLISGSGININGSPNNTPVIAENIITGNWWGITIQNGSTVQAGPQPNLGNLFNASPLDDGDNVIKDNIQNGTVYDLYNNCTNDIYAHNNDWGVYDSTEIEDHIFHKVDDAAHGSVFFVPFWNPTIPVELSSFAANVVGETIQLVWETATETNNKEFEVERSEDGELFTKVGYMDGNGTTSEKQSYTFTDHHAVSGTYYYRLRQVDFDGTSSYSDAVEVDFVPTEYSLGQNYPNPFNPSTRIKFAVPVDSKVTVTLYNMLGQKLRDVVSRSYSVGLHEVDFNASELSSGMYIYSISAQGVDGSNFVDTKKMMLLK